jgi:hypothetical protein
VAGIYKADNVQDAVSLAEEMRANCRYDWFRGQVSNGRHTHPLIASGSVAGHTCLAPT